MEIILDLDKLQDAPIVKITWVDAQTSAGWDKPKVDLATCITVGFLVSETEEGICVAGTVSDGMCNNTMSIPRTWIIDQQLEESDETPVRKAKGKTSTAKSKRRNIKKLSAT